MVKLIPGSGKEMCKLLELKPVQMIVLPTHDNLDDSVQLVKTNLIFHQKNAAKQMA